MRRVALPFAALALLTAACGANGAVDAGKVNDLVPPPNVLPNSVVRIDPITLEPIQVVPVGDAPDLVIAAGGYVWVTHYVLRDANSSAIRNGGDRTLTRVDPSTGDATVVGGGLAPCGLAADPSGDVWVANCFPRRSGQKGDVVLVDAKTFAFKETWPLPGGGHGYFRGLAYGGGSIWASDDVAGTTPKLNAVTRVDARTGAEQTFRLDRPAGALAWSEPRGDIWINNFDQGSITRLHADTGAESIVDHVATTPSSPALAGDVVWAGDWDGPQVERFNAVGAPSLRSIPLPASNPAAGVWRLAVGAGFVWATTPRDGALWRIDPATGAVTRIAIPYLPTGVTATAEEVWVTVREN